MELKYWHHPTETMNYLRENTKKTSAIQVFTDGSNSEQGVGAGVAIFKRGDHIASLKFRLKKDAQQSSRAAGNIESTRVYRKHANRRQDCHHMHRQINDTEFAKNSNIHTYFNEETRRKLTDMRKIN